MWKPGQLVTINHKTYQVRKDENYWGACTLCAFLHYEPDVYPCSKCAVSSKDVKVPDKCYLKRIYKASDRRNVGDDVGDNFSLRGKRTVLSVKPYHL